MNRPEDNTRPADKFYDELGIGYELMINWDARLKRESPFFRTLFDRYGVKRVLDCACGSGHHAIEFARWGLEAAGCDISSEMIRIAERNASTAGVNVRFFQAGLTETDRAAGTEAFDAIVCLGNSLPHLLTQHELARSIRSIRRALVSDGIFIAQIRNYERILRENLRFMPPTSAEWDGNECIFFRMLDIHGPRWVDFHIMRFLRGSKGWTHTVQTTRLRPITKQHLDAALERAGFSEVLYYGDYSFTPFESGATMDLIVVAR
jgi:SAM-dependent methyltransferase